MIKELISRLTMIKMDEPCYNVVAEKEVYYWQDYYFDIYIASSRWGIRVKIN
jgi:hypothetical protein